MRKIIGAALFAATLVVQIDAVGAQTVQVPAAQPGVVVQPGTTVIVPAPAPTVVAPAPVVVAPSASPATVTVITTTVAPRFCGGAYRPDMGTNFGGC